MSAKQADLGLDCGEPAPRHGVSERRMRLRAFMKTNGILTHSMPGDCSDSKWLAVLVPDKRLDDGGPIAGINVGDMIAHFGRLLHESGRTAYAATEREAVFLLAEENHLQGVDFWP